VDTLTETNSEQELTGIQDGNTVTNGAHLKGDTMIRHSLLITIVILVTLTGKSISFAQSHSKNQSSEKDFIAEPITVETSTGTLYGTLTMPRSRSLMPIVLIIPGSGPTDRDGNSSFLKGPNNSIKLLAEGLAAQGLASVRYDKRGIGETGKALLLAAEKAKTPLREEDLSFETYIDDAVRWGKQLRADQRFSSLTILGHSEGSLIGMVAAQRFDANGFISIAGAGRPIQDLILKQAKSQLTPELFKTTEDILNQLIAGKTVEAVPAELNSLFRPSVQPFMISWLRYDPTKEITKLRVPVLILQGTTDMQVGTSDANRLAAANPAGTLILIEGMNHVLKLVPNEPAKQVSSYSDPTLPVSRELINSIKKFVIK
jgi:uncharacterized protein